MTDEQLKTLREECEWYRKNDPTGFMNAPARHVFWLIDEILRCREALREVEWQGNGKDKNLFYCPACRASHEDCTKIPHRKTCVIRSALEVKQ